MYRVPIPWNIVAAPGHGGVGHVCVAQETNCVPFPGFILDLSKKLWHHCLLEHSFFASFTFVIQRPIGQLGLQVWPCCITYSFSFGISSVNYNILRLCESWNAVNFLIIFHLLSERNEYYITAKSTSLGTHIGNFIAVGCSAPTLFILAFWFFC